MSLVFHRALIRRGSHQLARAMLKTDESLSRRSTRWCDLVTRSSAGDRAAMSTAVGVKAEEVDAGLGGFGETQLTLAGCRAVGLELSLGQPLDPATDLAIKAQLLGPAEDPKTGPG